VAYTSGKHLQLDSIGWRIWFAAPVSLVPMLGDNGGFTALLCILSVPAAAAWGRYRRLEAIPGRIGEQKAALTVTAFFHSAAPSAGHAPAACAAASLIASRTSSDKPTAALAISSPASAWWSSTPPAPAAKPMLTAAGKRIVKTLT